MWYTSSLSLRTGCCGPALNAPCPSPGSPAVLGSRRPVGRGMGVRHETHGPLALRRPPEQTPRERAPLYISSVHVCVYVTHIHTRGHFCICGAETSRLCFDPPTSNPARSIGQCWRTVAVHVLGFLSLRLSLPSPIMTELPPILPTHPCNLPPSPFPEPRSRCGHPWACALLIGSPRPAPGAFLSAHLPCQAVPLCSYLSHATRCPPLRHTRLPALYSPPLWTDFSGRDRRRAFYLNFVKIGQVC